MFDFHDYVCLAASGGKECMVIMKNTLNLVTTWDKTFPKNNNINHQKVTFHNRYDITFVADMYTPKDIEGK